MSPLFPPVLKRDLTAAITLENCLSVWYKVKLMGFPGGAVVENPPANAGDMGLIPGPRRSHMPRSN